MAASDALLSADVKPLLALPRLTSLSIRNSLRLDKDTVAALMVPSFDVPSLCFFRYVAPPLATAVERPC